MANRFPWAIALACVSVTPTLAQRVLDDGHEHVIESASQPLIVYGDTSVVMRDGASVLDIDAVGVWLNDNSRLQFEGGTIKGGAGIRAEGASAVHMTGGELNAVETSLDLGGSGWAVELRDEARFTVNGGVLASENRGIESSGRSILEFSDASLQIRDSDPTRGVILREASEARFRDAQYEMFGNRNLTPLFTANDDSHLIIESGKYGLTDLDTTGHRSLIEANNGGRVALLDGVFQASFDCQISEASVYRIHEQAHLQVTGGATTLSLCRQFNPVGGGKGRVSHQFFGGL